jgi:hypothetical protein
VTDNNDENSSELQRELSNLRQQLQELETEKSTIEAVAADATAKVNHHVEEMAATNAMATAAAMAANDHIARTRATAELHATEMTKLKSELELKTSELIATRTLAADAQAQANAAQQAASNAIAAATAAVAAAVIIPSTTACISTQTSTLSSSSSSDGDDASLVRAHQELVLRLTEEKESFETQLETLKRENARLLMKNLQVDAVESLTSQLSTSNQLVEELKVKLNEANTSLATAQAAASHVTPMGTKQRGILRPSTEPSSLARTPLRTPPSTGGNSSLSLSPPSATSTTSLSSSSLRTPSPSLSSSNPLLSTPRTLIKGMTTPMVTTSASADSSLVTPPTTIFNPLSGIKLLAFLFGINSSMLIYQLCQIGLLSGSANGSSVTRISTPLPLPPVIELPKTPLPAPVTVSSSPKTANVVVTSQRVPLTRRAWNATATMASMFMQLLVVALLLWILLKCEESLNADITIRPRYPHTQ